MTRTGKRLTYLTITLGIVVLLIAGCAFKDKAMEPWYLLKLESDDEAIRVAAAEKLGEMKSLKAVPLLVGLLRELPEPKLGRDLYFLITEVGERIRVVEMKDDYWEQLWLGKALVEIGVQGVPLLLECFRDEDYRFNENLFMDLFVRKTLQRIGPAAIPILTPALQSSNPNTRRLALLTLAKFGNASDEAVPSIATLLTDEHSGVRLAAAVALWHLGSASQRAVPELRKATSDSNENVRKAATEALKKIQGGNLKDDQ